MPVALAVPVIVARRRCCWQAPAARRRRQPFKAGLVTDVGRFNDKGFNQSQLTG